MLNSFGRAGIEELAWLLGATDARGDESEVRRFDNSRERAGGRRDDGPGGWRFEFFSAKRGVRGMSLNELS